MAALSVELGEPGCRLVKSRCLYCFQSVMLQLQIVNGEYNNK